MTDSKRLTTLVEAMRTEIGKAVVGHGEVVDALIIGLVSGGHVLLEGVPGTAKTLLARSLAYVLDISFKRIQFSPDLMPSDVVGTNVFDAGEGTFHVRTGPIFANVVLADEINRTPPKTQAALLEAMQEGRVTIDGVAHPLPEPFFVVATQNPIEYEGTYPLPEAQLDRFGQKVIVPYPSEADEVSIVMHHTGGLLTGDLAAFGMRPVGTAADVLAARAQLDEVTVDEGVARYVASIVRATREHPAVHLGASPRAGVTLLVTAKARALLAGRTFVTPDDVKSSVHACLRHRILLRPEIEIEGAEVDEVLGDVLSEVPVPR